MPASVFGTGNEVIQNLLQQLVDIETNEQGSANGNYGEITVTTTSTLISAANATRHTIAIKNIGAEILYVSNSATATLNGFPVGPQGTLEIEGYFGAITGITPSGTTMARYIEVI